MRVRPVNYYDDICVPAGKRGSREPSPPTLPPDGVPDSWRGPERSTVALPPAFQIIARLPKPDERRRPTDQGPTTMRRAKISIIGAGNVGATCAHWAAGKEL